MPGYKSVLKTQSISLSTNDLSPYLMQVRFVGGVAFSHTITPTFVVNATGGTGSKGLLQLITVADAGETDETTTTNSIDFGAAAGDTLQECLNQINALTGWEARINANVEACAMDHDDWVAVSSTWLVPGKWTSILQAQKDSFQNASYVLLHNYAQGKAGMVAIHKIVYNINFSTDVAGNQIQLRDHDGNLLYPAVAAVDNTVTTIDWSTAPRTFRGPVLVGFKAAAAITSLTQFDVVYELVRL